MSLYPGRIEFDFQDMLAVYRTVIIWLSVMQNRCVNMIAHLFHAPVGDDETAVGVGTVGSSEAIMLAGLAFKRKWQAKRKAQGKPCDNPNIVTGANVQVSFHLLGHYLQSIF